MNSATAFAPASVANVAVGFDTLGFSLPVLGDRVTVTLRDTGSPGEVVVVHAKGAASVPSLARKNTASAALLRLLEIRDIRGRLEVSIEKGIPLGSGLGGSAASAAGAVAAANELLDEKLSADEALDCALAGESVASGDRHADNVAPSLFGGFVAAFRDETRTSGFRTAALPLPKLHAAVVRPHLSVNTRDARAVIPENVPFRLHTEQLSYMAGFLAGLFSGDHDTVRRCFRDIVVEPHRSALIPGFAKARERTLATGALGFAISGAGPSVFALAEDEATAIEASRAMEGVFLEEGLGADVHLSPFSEKGAMVLES